MSTHSSATVLLVKPSGKILMQLRDDGNGKIIPYPNMWNFLGGAVEGDETHVEAAAREIMEETEIHIVPDMLKLIFVYDHDQTVDDHIFIYHVAETATAVCNEGTKLEWLPFPEIKKLHLGFGQAQILPSLEEYFQEKLS